MRSAPRSLARSARRSPHDVKSVVTLRLLRAGRGGRLRRAGGDAGRALLRGPPPGRARGHGVPVARRLGRAARAARAPRRVPHPRRRALRPRAARHRRGSRSKTSTRRRDPTDPDAERVRVVRATDAVVDSVEAGRRRRGALPRWARPRRHRDRVRARACSATIPTTVVAYLDAIHRVRGKGGWPESPWQAEVVRSLG